MFKRAMRTPREQVVANLRRLMGDIDAAELDTFFKVDWDTFDHRVQEHNTARFLPAFEKAFGETKKAAITFEHSPPLGEDENETLLPASFCIQFECTLKDDTRLAYKQTAHLVPDIYSPDAGDYFMSYSKRASDCSAEFSGSDELLPCLVTFIEGIFDIIEPKVHAPLFDDDDDEADGTNYWCQYPGVGYHAHALSCILDSAPCTKPDRWSLDELW